MSYGHSLMSQSATQSRPSTSDAKVMIKTYTPNLARKEDPLKWWAENEKCYPFLASHAKTFFSISATSVHS